MAEFVFLALVVVLEAPLGWEVLAAFLVLVAAVAEAILVPAVVGFAGGCFSGAVLVAGLSGAVAVALLVVPAGAEVPRAFGAFVVVAGALVVAAELGAAAALAEVLDTALLALLFAAGADLAVAVVLAAGFAVTVPPEVILVLVAETVPVGVALTGLEEETLTILVLDDAVAVL